MGWNKIDIFTHIDEYEDRQRLQILVLTLIRNKIPAIVLSDQSFCYRYDIFDKQELNLDDQIYIKEKYSYLPIQVRDDDEAYIKLLETVSDIKSKYEAGAFTEGKWCVINGFILYYTIGMFVALDVKLLTSRMLVIR